MNDVPLIEITRISIFTLEQAYNAAFPPLLSVKGSNDRIFQESTLGIYRPSW
jgi:hypothetical protein